MFTAVPELAGKVIALVPDLMDKSKVANAWPHASFVREAGELSVAAAAAGTGDLVVVDLARPGALDAVAVIVGRAGHPRVVGFGSHVDTELLDAAREAGCDEVLTRSTFFARLAAPA